MVSSSSLREQKKIDLSNKLQILKTIINSKSMNTTSIIKDAMIYIKDQEYQLEGITRECEWMDRNDKEVKLEKNGNRFNVRVTCKKGEHLPVSIIGAFENLDLMVLHAKTKSEQFFFMGAIVEDEHQVLDVMDVTNAILIAIGM